MGTYPQRSRAGRSDLGNGLQKVLRRPAVANKQVILAAIPSSSDVHVLAALMSPLAGST